MLDKFFTKQSPILSLLGMGGGIARRAAGAAATPPSEYVIFGTVEDPPQELLKTLAFSKYKNIWNWCWG